jgi:hypothetical protein
MNNNQRNETIYVHEPLPDLYLKYYYRPRRYAPLETIPEIEINGFWGLGPIAGAESATITEKVYNNDFEHMDYVAWEWVEPLAEYPAFDFYINFSEYDDEDEKWEAIDTVFIEELYVGESKVVSVVWNTSCEAGRWHTIRALADPHETMDEAREDNNFAYYNGGIENLPYLEIYVYPNCPDITPTEISFSDQGDLERLITATIQNIGGLNATNVTVEFWDNTTNESIGTREIDFLRGKHGSTQVSIPYNFTTFGTYEIRVDVDPDNQINETDSNCNYTVGENNNNFTQLILILPDLVVEEITFYSITDPLKGDPVYINATIHNNGNYPILANQSFNVTFYYDGTFIDKDALTGVTVVVSHTHVAILDSPGFITPVKASLSINVPS